MRITKTANSFEFVPDTEKEAEGLRCLVGLMQMHPSGVAENCSAPFDADKLLSDGELLILDVIQRNSSEVRRRLGLEPGVWSS